MTSNVTASPLQVDLHTMSTSKDLLSIGADHPRLAHHEEDERSSSLSEIGERADHDRPDITFSDGSDVNDTEAETERLEDSPQKMRTNQNLVMTSNNGVHEERPKILTPPNARVMDDPQSDVEMIAPTSDLSSFADSGEENVRMLSTGPPAFRKRKRSGFEPDIISNPDIPAKSSTNATRTPRDISAGPLGEDPSSSDFAGEEEVGVFADTGALPIHESRLHGLPESTIPSERYHKGRRKGRKTHSADIHMKDTEAIALGSITKKEDDHETVSSNEENGDNDDIQNEAGADHGTKHEGEGLQKNFALVSLNAMEKYFATFRDKLFEERLSQLNAELLLLESATPMYPELIAMKNVIDQRRDQKLRYEQNLMQYKLQTLQRESVAKKAQAHSHYMQTVREIRDSSLEKLNQQFYQLQKERRSADGDVPDYLYEFSSKRSQWITHQTAYNAEVSILSGMAKFVGFPAAPDISKAKRKEVEDDLRSMGISTNVQPTSHNHLPPLRTMSTNSNLPRPKKGADEHFLEQNPWANPQHPSHHQRRILHRQLSGLSRAVTPVAATAIQRRIADPTEPRVATSTLPDHSPEQKSSIAATPAMNAHVDTEQNSQHHAINSALIDTSPSNTIGSSALATRALSAPFELLSERGKDTQRSRIDLNYPPPLPLTSSQDDQTPKHLPKPLPFSYTGASAPGLRTSTPGRYNVVEAESKGYLSQRSPMPQYHNASVKPATNGVTNRFAT